MFDLFGCVWSAYIVCARARAQFFCAAAGSARALNFAAAAGASARRRVKTHEQHAANAFLARRALHGCWRCSDNLKFARVVLTRREHKLHFNFFFLKKR